MILEMTISLLINLLIIAIPISLLGFGLNRVFGANKLHFIPFYNLFKWSEISIIGLLFLLQFIWNPGIVVSIISLGLIAYFIKKNRVIPKIAIGYFLVNIFLLFAFRNIEISHFYFVLTAFSLLAVTLKFSPLINEQPNSFNTSIFGRVYFKVLAIIFFISLNSSYLANEIPIYHNNEFTVYQKLQKDEVAQTNFKKYGNNVVKTPILYSPGSFDEEARLQLLDKVEFNASATHLLGTDRLGRDLLTNLLHGTETSFIISLFSTFFALIIGTILGLYSGYFFDKPIHISYPKLLSIFISIFIAWFIGFKAHLFIGAKFEIIYNAALFITLLVVLIYVLNKWNPTGKTIKINLDSISNYLIEIINSFPGLLLILLMVSFLSKSLFWIILILGITSWITIARLIRAQAIKLSKSNFVEYAKASGFNKHQIILKSILPNLINEIIFLGFSLFTAMFFIEISINFLNITTSNYLSLGTILNYGYAHLELWWVIFFPVLLISMVGFCCYRLSSKH